ncbi:hypothetical protein PG987_012446 [Apiospora arundinis]
MTSSLAQRPPSILETFKTKLNNDWRYHACHWHDANSKGGCLRADSESGEWVTHCCTKDFYHTSEIVKWMRQKNGKTGLTNLSALLSAAQDSGHHLRNQPGRLKASDLGKIGRESYIVFAILLNLDCGFLIRTFQRFGITDGNLSNEGLSNLDALKEDLQQSSVSDVNKLLNMFDDMRFMFQHVVMDLNTPTVYSDRRRGRWISPFCRRQLINNKGGTAQVWQVSVQDRFLSTGLKERLKRSEYNDPVYGKCYSMALKTFTSENKHVFNQEKLNYSAVEGLAGMVQYLGEYEVDEETDGQRVVRTWNLLLEFGDLDLEELFFSPKDPPSAFDTILGFWEALSKVAEAVERIHNLEAHRDSGDSVRYHGWHADIKPDNILRVHGEFKLADLGFAKFRMKDETGLEPKTILTGLTETYGAPETDIKRRGRPRGTLTDYTQKIDIWSLGCVFSVAATWVVLGRQGVWVYEKLRQNAIRQLRESSSGKQPTADDAFHDGQEVLVAVTAWHNHLRSSMRKSDTITSKILDLVDTEMLRREPRERLSSIDLLLRFAEFIPAARATHDWHVQRGEWTPLSDYIKDAVRQVEEEAEILADMDGEGDTVKVLLSQNQSAGGRSSGAMLAHNSHQSNRRNKSEFMRQAKKSMRLPRRDHIGTSSHLSSRTGKSIFITARPASGVFAGELRIPPPEMPVAPHLRERKDEDTPSASNPPTIVIGDAQVESPKLMAEHEPEIQPGGAHHLEDTQTPELEAITQPAHTRKSPPQITINTQETPEASTVLDHSAHSNGLYEVDTRPTKMARPQSMEGTGGLYTTVKSPISPSRDGTVPRTPTSGKLNSLPTRFEIEPNWQICRQLDSIKKKGFFKSLMGGNDRILSSFLVNRDIKFVIDNGGSMRPYWPAMKIALETLANMIGSLDKDGLDMEFTLGKDYNISNAPARKLLERFDKASADALQPQDDSKTGTDMAMILGQIFFDYLKNTSKPMTLIVFTDGFDNDLESKYGIRDVIDHEPVSGDVYKMILGSVNKIIAQAYWLPETLGHVKTCVVPKNKTGTDDTPNVVKTTTECGDHSRVVFEKDVTYSLWTPLQLKALSNVEFVFNGNVTLPNNVTYVESVVADTNLYPGRWINFQGVNVTLTGSEDPKEGWLIGHGELWWPGGAANSANKGRPHFFSLKVNYLRARHLKVWKPVAWVFSMGGSYVWMTDTLIDARSDDGFPFNTDGIDMSASHSLIEGFTIYNGDDLINVAPPRDQSGGNYLFENAVVEDSLIGARFKGKLDTTCDLHNVTWRNFTVRNTSYPIHFIENYVDQEKGVPPGSNVSLAAYATNFTWENFVGQTGQSLKDGSCISDPCWSSTLGESTDKGIYLLCADQDHCKGFHFSNIDLKAYDGTPAEMECTGLNGISGMGIECTNSTIVLA